MSISLIQLGKTLHVISDQMKQVASGKMETVAAHWRFVCLFVLFLTSRVADGSNEKNTDTVAKRSPGHHRLPGGTSRMERMAEIDTK